MITDFAQGFAAPDLSRTLDIEPTYRHVGRGVSIGRNGLKTGAISPKPEDSILGAPNLSRYRACRLSPPFRPTASPLDATALAGDNFHS